VFSNRILDICDMTLHVCSSHFKEWLFPLIDLAGHLNNPLSPLYSVHKLMRMGKRQKKLEVLLRYQIETKMRQDLQYTPSLDLRLCAGAGTGMFTHCKI
jgi:hypothetical protein